MKQLETPRLILRDWEETDLGCGVHNDETIRYLLAAKNNYAIVLKETGEVIGTIGLNEDADDHPERRNVGIRVIEAFRDRGFMSEALSEVIQNAGEITHTLSWFCKTTDLRSQHLAEKFGFQYVKTFYQTTSGHDAPADFHYYIRSV